MMIDLEQVSCYYRNHHKTTLGGAPSARERVYVPYEVTDILNALEVIEGWSDANVIQADWRP